MQTEDREALAAALLEMGALRVEKAALRWAEEAPTEPQRRALLEALLALIRAHYPAAEAVLGGSWAERAGQALALPYEPEMMPSRPLLVAPTLAEAAAELPRLWALREAGGSPAIAVIFQGGEAALREELDRADVRCHWLTDLEAVAAAALQGGLLDFEDYCRLLPQM